MEQRRTDKFIGAWANPPFHFQPLPALSFTFLRKHSNWNYRAWNPKCDCLKYIDEPYYWVHISLLELSPPHHHKMLPKKKSAICWWAHHMPRWSEQRVPTNKQGGGGGGREGRGGEGGGGGKGSVSGRWQGNWPPPDIAPGSQALRGDLKKVNEKEDNKKIGYLQNELGTAGHRDQGCWNLI